MNWYRCHHRTFWCPSFRWWKWRCANGCSFADQAVNSISPIPPTFRQVLDVFLRRPTRALAPGLHPIGSELGSVARSHAPYPVPASDVWRPSWHWQLREPNRLEVLRVIFLDARRKSHYLPGRGNMCWKPSRFRSMCGRRTVLWAIFAFG